MAMHPDTKASQPDTKVCAKILCMGNTFRNALIQLYNLNVILLKNQFRENTTAGTSPYTDKRIT